MQGSQHIPIRPRFSQKSFNMPFAQPSEPTPRENNIPAEPSPSAQPILEEFDLFEVLPEENNKPKSPPPKKKPYDIMIIVMAVIIIILILVIVWLMLSNKEDPVPENMVFPQYMRPPGMQQQPMQRQPMQQQPMQQQPMQQQPMQPPPVSKTTKTDIDSVYEQLRQKNSSAKVESESNNNSRLSTIEEVDEEEDDEPNFDE
jgi:flagellar basal body-associated protein FliL